ncbi:uncharacterized protein C8R40DRAFT_1067158 [Lentinula edodes]|uniref:uncharacterized protein n=1 Tax=Lentinula edodes TaxID=5353 RepID=UPI001E8E26AB|nr:uncharacterized protein C8R40DRAFT_1067158 [Lentinula edodes]KAH7878773.1 hypothetical protein C8R40DRAFT_1067158 [Lentinula edodes]
MNGGFEELKGLFNIAITCVRFETRTRWLNWLIKGKKSPPLSQTPWLVNLHLDGTSYPFHPFKRVCLNLSNGISILFFPSSFLQAFSPQWARFRNMLKRRMAAASDEADNLRIELDALTERLKLRDETELRSRLTKQKALYVQTVATLKETMEDNRRLQTEFLHMRKTGK